MVNFLGTFQPAAPAKKDEPKVESKDDDDDEDDFELFGSDEEDDEVSVLIANKK